VDAWSGIFATKGAMPFAKGHEKENKIVPRTIQLRSLRACESVAPEGRVHAMCGDGTVHRRQAVFSRKRNAWCGPVRYCKFSVRDAAHQTAETATWHRPSRVREKDEESAQRFHYFVMRLPSSQSRSRRNRTNADSGFPEQNRPGTAQRANRK